MRLGSGLILFEVSNSNRIGAVCLTEYLSSFPRKRESSSCCCLIGNKSFHSPAASELLSLAWPRESNQREGHPVAALSGHPALRVRSRTTGFVERTSMYVQRTGAHRARHLSDCPACANRGEGAPFSGHPGRRNIIWCTTSMTEIIPIQVLSVSFRFGSSMQ